jgi:hypothetical protein
VDASKIKTFRGASIACINSEKSPRNSKTFFYRPTWKSRIPIELVGDYGMDDYWFQILALNAQ